MRMILTMTLALLAAGAAHADFSYTVTRRATGGMLGAMAAANGTSKVYLKGQKMKMDNGPIVIVVDFESQTLTTLDTAKKTYTVQPFSDIARNAGTAALELNIDAKETGQRRTINGFDASEFVMNIDMDPPQQAPQMGIMHMEMDMWIASEVPGVQELKSFYQKNGDKFPWSAMAGGGSNQNLQKAMVGVQQKLAAMNGVPVEQVVKVKSPAGMPGLGANASQACAKLEALKAQGGPMAEMIAKQAARMGCGGGAAANSGSLFEMTMDSSEFSTGSIPESVFATPDGYRKAN